MGAFKLSITDTVLVFVGIPAAVIATVYGLVYGGSAARGKRYRPGRKFDAQPVWFVAGGRSGRPGTTEAHAPDGAALAGRPAAGELTPSPDLEQVHYGETGGASDSW